MHNSLTAIIPIQMGISIRLEGKFGSAGSGGPFNFKNNHLPTGFLQLAAKFQLNILIF
jgi:hypothetical protein